MTAFEHFQSAGILPVIREVTIVETCGQTKSEMVDCGAVSVHKPKARIGSERSAVIAPTFSHCKAVATIDAVPPIALNAALQIGSGKGCGFLVQLAASNVIDSNTNNLFISNIPFKNYSPVNLTPEMSH